MKYVVLHQNNDDSFESTYFLHHSHAFSYCDNRQVEIKAVYKILSREPMTVGPLNVFCNFNDELTLRNHFSNDIHNYTFKVI